MLVASAGWQHVTWRGDQVGRAACFRSLIRGDVSVCVQALRNEAERYKRLANSIYNPAAAAELEAHARALEERAKAEEAKRVPEPPARAS